MLSWNSGFAHLFWGSQKRKRLFFFLRFIYFMYVSTLTVSSDTPEGAIRCPLQMVAGN
jgi:hypothetical protein